MNLAKWLTVFAFAVNAFSANVAHAQDEGRVYVNASLRGSYGVSLDGSAYLAVPGQPPQLVQVASVGWFRADGSGNITEGVRNISINGFHYFQNYTCTYNVQSNGTGTASCLIAETGLTETFYIVFNTQAKEIQFVTTTPGTIVTGVAKRQ